MKYPNSFSTDDLKISYVISMLHGPPKKWGLSLKADGTLNSLSYKTFKDILISNFGDTKEQKDVIIEQLLNLKPLHLGRAALYTIEFRRLAGRIEWPNDVFIDLIKRGLLEDVKTVFDKLDKPKILFEATNSIINIDRKCLLKQKVKTNDYKPRSGKSFKRKRHETNMTENKFKHNKHHKRRNNGSILSANYTTSHNNKMTTPFLLTVNNKKIKTRILIDSGSARSYLYKSFVTANKIPYSNLSNIINVKLPFEKNMAIKQFTKTS